MPVDDLAVLSEPLQARARRHSNGEVSWKTDDARAVVVELAAAGRVVLGLDVRDYGGDGSFVEAAWSDYSGTDAADAREAALQALSREPLPGDYVLVTW